MVSQFRKVSLSQKSLPYYIDPRVNIGAGKGLPLLNTGLGSIRLSDTAIAYLNTFGSSTSPLSSDRLTPYYLPTRTRACSARFHITSITSCETYKSSKTSTFQNESSFQCTRIIYSTAYLSKHCSSSISFDTGSLDSVHAQIVYFSLGDIIRNY